MSAQDKNASEGVSRPTVESSSKGRRETSSAGRKRTIAERDYESEPQGTSSAASDSSARATTARASVMPPRDRAFPEAANSSSKSRIDQDDTISFLVQGPEASVSLNRHAGVAMRPVVGDKGEQQTRSSSSEEGSSGSDQYATSSSAQLMTLSERNKIPMLSSQPLSEGASFHPALTGQDHIPEAASAGTTSPLGRQVPSFAAYQDNLSALDMTNVARANEARPSSTTADQALDTASPASLAAAQGVPPTAAFPTWLAPQFPLQPAVTESNIGLFSQGLPPAVWGTTQSPATIQQGAPLFPAIGLGNLNVLQQLLLNANAAALSEAPHNMPPHLLAAADLVPPASPGPAGGAGGGGVAVAAAQGTVLSPQGSNPLVRNNPTFAASAMSGASGTIQLSDPSRISASGGMQDGRRGPILYISCDDDILSDHQILLRQQIEFFEAQRDDIEMVTPGRRKPIVLNQVGIRCIHCAHLPLHSRARGSVYYPFKLKGLYQAAQNMSLGHFCRACPSIPAFIRAELAAYHQGPSSSGHGGRTYWAKTARSQGIVETEAGLRYAPDPSTD